MTPAMTLRTCFAAAFLLGSHVWAADPKMTPAERQKVIDLLQQSRVELLNAVEGLSDAQWHWKSAPERWSVAEVAEHITLGEGMLFAKVQEAIAAPPNPEWETKTAKKTEFLERVMPTRQGKAIAPEEIVPSGKWTQGEFRTKFEEARNRTLKFARDTQVPLKEYTAEHPFPVFNTLNAYQWLIYIPWHNQRHVKQIEEVKATPGFPKD
jgi:hypothetical protein